MMLYMTSVLSYNTGSIKNSGEIPRSSVDLGLSTSPDQFPDLGISIDENDRFVNGIFRRKSFGQLRRELVYHQFQ